MQSRRKCWSGEDKTLTFPELQPKINLPAAESLDCQIEMLDDKRRNDKE